jgi:hypothetical protein
MSCWRLSVHDGKALKGKDLLLTTVIYLPVKPRKVGCQKEIITFRSFTGRYMTVVSKRALPFKTLVMYTMAASRKWLPFEALQVGIWRLSAGDPYLSKPYRHIQKAASMTCIHFESLQLDTSIIWSLPADDSYLSKIISCWQPSCTWLRFWKVRLSCWQPSYTYL